MTPTREFSNLNIAKPRKLTTGLDRIIDQSCGRFHRRQALANRFLLEAFRIYRLNEKWRTESEASLRDRLDQARERFRRSTRKPRPDVVGVRQGLALAGVAAERTLGYRPYPVQFMSALIVARGRLAEMATGEGKTLSTALAAAVLAWSGKPVHIITANDYLARRDCEEMEELYRLCGIRAGYVVAEMEPDERRFQYGMDLTCTTSKEILADFLRDRLKYESINNPSRLLTRHLLDQVKGAGLREKVMRGLHTALVDEADSVLIDEAATPLIISQKYKNEAYNECCRLAFEISRELKPDRDYLVDFKHREINLTGKGRDRIDEQSDRLPRMWRNFDRSIELVKQALTAREFFKLDRDYIIDEGKVVIIDPMTGRQKRDSSWRGGIHQAVETKEGLEISDPAQTLASLSFQNFFRIFPRLGATTGTAASASQEFWHVYRLSVVKVPTHRPCIRRVLPARYFPTLQRKWEAVAREVRQLSHDGRPVLIGTSSVRASEQLAACLAELNLPFSILNAKEHREEAEIVKRAGIAGSVTIATNMAGRGTDIKLGDGVAGRGGLHVIAGERMESSRVDRQLQGRAGRQGDPGSTRTFVSMEDDLLQAHHARATLRQCAAALNVHSPGARAMAALLTNQAQRAMEKKQREQRESVMRMDKWLEESLSFTGRSAI